MYSKQHENLLPKKAVDGVALKTQLFQNSLSRLRGYRKQAYKIFAFSKLSRLFLGGLLVLYFAGYQPVLALPPMKKALVYATTEQKQDIEGYHLAQPFQLPHPGLITTRFSSWHPGLDLATGLGMPVHPVAPGTVSEVVYGFFGLGHYVAVEHEQGFKSIYGHMGKIFVKTGDKVTNSSIMGDVGVTGRTTGPHTHLEVTKDGKYINPLLVLPPLSAWPASASQAPQGKGGIKTEPTPTPSPKVEEPKISSKNLKLFSLEKITSRESTPSGALKSLNYLTF